jgi:hypothetical protein
VTNQRILVSTKKGLFTLARASRGSGAWRVESTQFLGHNVSLSLAHDDTTYACLALGHYGPKIRRSDDGGQTFVDVATPALPAPPAADGAKAPATSVIWALERTPSGKLWCGTMPGGVFTSVDRGDSWQLVESLWDHPDRKEWFGGGGDEPGVHSLLVDPRDPKRVALAVSCGGVWRSEDDGASWQVHGKGMYAAFMPPERREDPRVQDPHLIDHCLAQPDVVYAQHHNGVFKSEDGGRTFTELKVPPSSFGFAVAVHPTDPNTAWFVPATSDETRVPVDGKLVVSRTRDGGKTFDVVTKGLPQCASWDIVYRHALDVDDTGRALAFGSTTGGLWTSDDGGDSWTALDARLPPIAAVRFAT